MRLSDAALVIAEASCGYWQSLVEAGADLAAGSEMYPRLVDGTTAV